MPVPRKHYVAPVLTHTMCEFITANSCGCRVLQGVSTVLILHCPRHQEHHAAAQRPGAAA